ncbi:MAG: hypothetical protein KAH14_09280, partial [Clostridiales bacterium]|nr:hypothetical protein [Clostridiales bacterium]
MYSWNDIKINVEGNNTIFQDGIKKYINAVYIHDYEGESDIKATICDSTQTGIPPIPKIAKKVKSLVFNQGLEMRLDIFAYETQLWYIYRDVASVWFDYAENKLVVCLSNMPLDFEYANIQLFFFHPLGAMLENMGFFRIQGGCVSIDGESVLLAGPISSGKSAIALSAPTHGGKIISDDISFLYKDENGYHPSSLSSLVKISAESIIRYYPELNLLHEAAHYENETYFFMEDINNTRPDKTTLTRIVLLDKIDKSHTDFQEIHPAQILQQLFPTTIHT